MVCLNLSKARFSSTVVSVPVVSMSSSRISAMISPLFFIKAFCSDSALDVDKVIVAVFGGHEIPKVADFCKSFDNCQCCLYCFLALQDDRKHI